MLSCVELSTLGPCTIGVSLFPGESLAICVCTFAESVLFFGCIDWSGRASPPCCLHFWKDGLGLWELILGREACLRGGPFRNGVIFRRSFRREGHFREGVIFRRVSFFGRSLFSGGSQLQEGFVFGRKLSEETHFGRLCSGECHFPRESLSTRGHLGRMSFSGEMHFRERVIFGSGIQVTFASL